MNDINRAASYDDYDEQQWSNGWLIAKYNQNMPLPKISDGTYKIDSFYEGFIKGACEVGEYNQLKEYTRECIKSMELCDYLERSYFK